MSAGARQHRVRDVHHHALEADLQEDGVAGVRADQAAGHRLALRDVLAAEAELFAETRVEDAHLVI